ncbi:hypothetical protein Tco_1006951 [Tanacetum coccineum]|uniref:Uncharacterized protein n=1 Tax=Tanacetum coccineum TaxID=301880 RepID=A0ABQ5FJB9_9ASTR
MGSTDVRKAYSEIRACYGVGCVWKTGLFKSTDYILQTDSEETSGIDVTSDGASGSTGVEEGEPVVIPGMFRYPLALVESLTPVRGNHTLVRKLCLKSEAGVFMFSMDAE